MCGQCSILLGALHCFDTQSRVTQEFALVSAMRARSAPGARHGSRVTSSYSKLLMLVLGTACLIFGYLLLYSPSTGGVRSRALSSIKIRGGQDDGVGQTSQGDAVRLAATGGVHSANGVAQATHTLEQVVSHTDQRHPDNVQQLISEQSHSDEQKQETLAKASDGTQQGSNDAGAAQGARHGDQQKQMLAAMHKSKDQHHKQQAEGDAEGTPGAQNDAKAAGGTHAKQQEAAGGSDAKQAAGSVAASSPPAEEHHDIGSDVKATAASLQHAAEHLKKATEMLAKQAAEGKAAADTAGAAATSPAAAAAIASPTAAATTAAAGAVASPAAADPAGAGTVNATAAKPDLLAYSKSQNQPGETIHVLFTSNGSPYQNIQARVMVGTFNLVRKMPGGEKLVAMTRILHRTTPDEVMDEIPTFRAQPLQPECDKWCWFPVADRANAVQQWVDAVHKDTSMVKAPWVLLLETDYVWVKPLLAPGDAYDPKVPGLAFQFDYIAPRNPTVAVILKEKCPECDPATVPGSGPAPVLMRFSDLRAATPLWEDLSLWIETHPEAKKTLGWVREMYAWDIGVAANKLNILTQPAGTTTLIAQPPHDHTRGNATMYHYTWGCIIKDKDGKEVWKFDKRFYTEANDALKLPTFPEPPPWVEGLHVHDGTPWTKNLRDTMLDMISQMNRAVATLPNLLEAKQS